MPFNFWKKKTHFIKLNFYIFFYKLFYFKKIFYKLKFYKFYYLKINKKNDSKFKFIKINLFFNKNLLKVKRIF